MIVGEGRAGKTALSNSMIGKPFADTDSTIGINALTCNIQNMSVNENDGWGHVPEGMANKHFESMIAKNLHSQTNAKSNNTEASSAMNHNLFTAELNSGGYMNTSTATVDGMDNDKRRTVDIKEEKASNVEQCK